MNRHLLLPAPLLAAVRPTPAAIPVNPEVAALRERALHDDTAFAIVEGIITDQSGLRHFDYHHTPEDTLDRINPEQPRQHVAAWTTRLAVLADAPENLLASGG